MPTFFIEGFEPYPDALDFNDSEALESNLGAKALLDDTGFFANAAEGCVITDATYRIAGKSLRWTRDAAQTWSQETGHRLGFSFVPRDNVCVGFGVHHNVRPTGAVPLLQFTYNEGAGEEEQCCLWATPDGGLFFASSNYYDEFIDFVTVVPIPQLQTAAGTIRWGAWNYIEVFVDLSQDTPTVSVRVNSSLVLNAVAFAGAQKMGVGFIGDVHFINCATQIFGSSYVQHIDDIYMTDGGTGFLGPQQCLLIGIDGIITSEWDEEVSPPALPEISISTPNTGNTNIYSIEDLPPGISQINGVAVHCKVSSGAGQMATVSFGLRNEADAISYETVSVSQAFLWRRATFWNLPGSGVITDAAEFAAIRLFVTSEALVEG